MNQVTHFIIQTGAGRKAHTVRSYESRDAAYKALKVLSDKRDEEDGKRAIFAQMEMLYELCQQKGNQMLMDETRRKLDALLAYFEQLPYWTRRLVDPAYPVREIVYHVSPLPA